MAVAAIVVVVMIRHILFFLLLFLFVFFVFDDVMVSFSNTSNASETCNPQF